MSSFRRRSRVAVVGPSEIAADIRDVLGDEHDVLRRVWLPGTDAPRALDDGVDAVLLVAFENELERRVPAARRALRVPLLVMTLDASPHARARALDLGADDALSATWEDEELRARVRAVLRRAPAPQPGAMQIDDLELDVATRTVRRGNEDVHVSPAEFAVLQMLLRNPGAVVRREEVAREVWGDPEAAADGRLHTTVSTLRAKIDRPPYRALIRTIHRVGYALRR
ncbi:MAG TPA: winged-helix domain-containing protein [Candidatus Elarobacter sp.]